jgi:hypothetical protein
MIKIIEVNYKSAMPLLGAVEEIFSAEVGKDSGFVIWLAL